MPLICPDCLAGGIRIVASLELEPDAASDEITLQIAECRACGTRRVAVYEESRRGSEPAWRHTVYDVDDVEIERLAELIAKCPTPRTSGCGCAAHRSLGRRRSDGTWSIAEVARLRGHQGRPFRYGP